MMMRLSFLIFTSFIVTTTAGQELFPNSEPASNMPSKSISVKLSSMYGNTVHNSNLGQRYVPEVMFGLNKKWMMHASFGFGNMHENYFYYEFAKVYAKYRFLSIDEVHKHFRMAAFASATYSRNQLHHNEINLANGDQGGIQAGIIATQLWHKFAISGTASISEVLDEVRSSKQSPQPYAFESFNYSLSAGYLVFPRSYIDYDQINVNIYAELIGGRNLDWPSEKYYVDLAPAVQLIFNSTSKLNLSYRFQLNSDISRMMKESFMISYERIFLNALRKKNK
jgi:hypothetical protein